MSDLPHAACSPYRPAAAGTARLCDDHAGELSWCSYSK